MTLRTNSKTGVQFYGCTNFRYGCHGTLPYKPDYKASDIPHVNKHQVIASQVIASQPDKIFIPSPYQQKIFDTVKTSNINLIIQAVAGSGKSTTLVKIVELLPHDFKSIFLAFNTSIVKDLSTKIPDYCMVKTMHSLGLQNVKKSYPHIRIEENKLYYLFKNYITLQSDQQAIEDLKNNKNLILRLVNLIKDSMLDCSMKSLVYLTDRYSLVLNSDTQVILNCITYLFTQSIRDHSTIDFGDMIYFCASGIVQSEKYDILLVDESQDLNPSQLKLLEYSLTSTGRLIAVGDRLQSIYGFRAADVESMDKIKAKFNCIELPLSICYRCQQSVIELINQEFPTIEFFGKSNNSTGILESIDSNHFDSLVNDADLVLCRNNAPLVKPAYRLLSQGKKVIIKGKEIGKNLIDLIEKISKKYNAYTILDLLSASEDYRSLESDKLNRLNQTRKLESLNDQIDCIVNFSEGLDSIQQMIQKISTIFSDDDTTGITFSTIHKAKGLESDNVYMLNPELLKSKANQEWEVQQAENLKYVGYTRSKKALYFVISNKV
jgi:superfamily I DNA/RNA helicase